MAIGLPTLLVLLALSYDIQVIRATDTAPPLRWLTAKDWLSIPFKGILAAVFVFTGLYTGLIVSLRNPTYERYSMSWRNTSNSRCSNEVTLEFNSAHGYRVWTCSPRLLAYLDTSNAKDLDVEFKVTYRLGIWEYELVRVGQFTAAAHLEGLGWSCRGDDTSCASWPPIRQPYDFK